MFSDHAYACDKDQRPGTASLGCAQSLRRLGGIETAVLPMARLAADADFNVVSGALGRDAQRRIRIFTPEFTETKHGRQLLDTRIGGD
jgi:hypothetical protein